MRKIAVLATVLLLSVTGFTFAQMMGQSPGGPDGWGGMMGGWWSSTPPGNTQALTIDQAWQSAERYVKDFWKADLQLTEVMEFDNQFYAEVAEKSSGVHAFEVLVNRWTGAIVPEPGPNVMWNTKYGHMGFGMMGGGMMGGPGWGWGGRQGYRPWGNPGKEMTVSAEQARKYAQEFLDTRLPGMKVETDADMFYGYYTIHVLNKDGSVYGMMGVNGYTGWVWYHEWHGKFVRMKELKDMQGG